MRIAGIAASFPSRIVANNDVLDMIRKHSEGGFQGNLRSALRRVRHFLIHSGIESRRWLSSGEQPIRLLSDAVSGALDEGNTKADEIDLLVYVGVGGAFREPGNSYMVAQALGMTNAQCFDVRDACMSWSRALQLVYNLFRGDGAYTRALIVNAECMASENVLGVPAMYTLRDSSELDWKFPAYTIGDAATATLLVADPSREWEFHFSSRPDLADLCTWPEPGYEGYCTLGLDTDPEERQRTRIGRSGINLFTSFATDLFAAVSIEEPAIFRRLRCKFDDIRMVFPHAASKKWWEDVGKEVGAPPTYYVYPRYGNIVSASVPAGIHLARQEGLIKRGDRLVGWVASAGMSFAAYSFIY